MVVVGDFVVSVVYGFYPGFCANRKTMGVRWCVKIAGVKSSLA